ncbi:DsrE family protein [Nitrospina watsonii]|uniref:Uncharacterized protein n=1 Tax=Nitrospina watsonii TaxID=1323948 RepID=A0ABN8W1T4_9BACT|nr:DsrE family protein [Nitrospina watsonii]CAI2717091.1 conserved protein of unknown function [Nitrospina watsonii]
MSLVCLRRKTLAKTILLILGAGALFLAFPSGAISETTPSANSKKHFLFHIKTSLEKDDAQICVAPNLAWAALHGGHRVTLLFDGSAVTSVKKKWRILGPAATDMDRAPLPDREKKALAEQFNEKLETIPDNYGDYLAFLKERGAKLYINKTMTVLYNIDSSEIDPNLTPVSLSEMVKAMENADIYIVY